MEASLRQRLRGKKLSCRPWKHWKGEIDYLPISAKTLFSNNGEQIDVVEKELKSEGWLSPHEDLFELLHDERNLRRPHMKKYWDIYTQGVTDTGDFPEDWTEEDFEHFESEK